jgi:hypothetical protein
MSNPFAGIGSRLFIAPKTVKNHPSESSIRHLVALLLEKPHAGFDDSRIIQDAFLGLDLVQGGPDAQGRAVGSMGSHRFDHIGDAEDAGLDEDIVPFQAFWVAGAVQALVMLVDDLGQRPVGLHVFKDLIALPGVLLDQISAGMDILPMSWMEAANWMPSIRSWGSAISAAMAQARLADRSWWPAV